MKQITKRTLAVLLALVVLLGTAAVAFADTATGREPIEPSKNQYKRYVCIGDSIAAGMYTPGYNQLCARERVAVPYGKDKINYDAYHSYVKDAIGAEEFYLYAFGAYSTNEYLYLLNDGFAADYDLTIAAQSQTFGLMLTPALMDTFKEDLRNAIRRSDIITVNVGNNDIFTKLWTLRPRYSYFYRLERVLSAFNFPAQSISKLHDFGINVNCIRYVMQNYQKAMDDFKANWALLFQSIRTLNPDIQIVAVSLTNIVGESLLTHKLPLPIGKLLDLWVREANDYISSNFIGAGKYIYADITDIPLGEELYLGEISMDRPQPNSEEDKAQTFLYQQSHPTADEHYEIAKRIVKVISEKKTTATWQLPE